MALKSSIAGVNMNEILRQTVAVLAWIWTAVSWIAYPIGVVLWYLAIALLYVFKLLYQPVAFLLLPVLYLGRFLLACLILPFQIAARFETLYIYLGVAALVGLAGGLIAGGTYLWLHKLLRLESQPKLLPGRTAKQYREEKRKQQIKAKPPMIDRQAHSPNGYSSSLLSPGTVSPTYSSLSDGTRKGKRPRALLTQTIMEEDDSDY